MDKDSRDKRFIRKPIYPGGQKAYREFITKQLVYPEEAKKKGIEGFVQLRYDINYKGDVIDAKVISSLGFGCDEEAIRIVKLLKFEVPKGPRKLKLLFHRTVRINFKISKSQIGSADSNTMLYKYVQSKKIDKNDDNKKVYSYTINISN